MSERQPADKFRASGIENRIVSRSAAISKSCGSVKEMCWVFKRFKESG
jgi:hypothetical protein